MTTTVGDDSSWAYSVALQADGRIVVGGGIAADEFALVRYNADGSLDATFGSGGKVTTSFGGNRKPTVWSVAIYKSGPNVGKIVAVGESGNDDFALVRLNPDGSLDPSFGTAGQVVTDFFDEYDDHAYSVAIQADGKVVVAGRSDSAGSRDFALARYDASGSLDASFGVGGKVTTHFFTHDEATSIALQGDGKILAAGHAEMGAGAAFALTRYDASGALDASFGVGGKVTTNIGVTIEHGYSVAVQADGKIVVAGSSALQINTASSNFAVARYTANGLLDSSFGTGGTVSTDFGNNDFLSDEIPYSVALQADGKIVVAGLCAQSGQQSFAVARYDALGSLDTSFGTGGKVITPFGSTGSWGNSVVLQADGKIVVAGPGGQPQSFAVARYIGEPVPVCPSTSAIAAFLDGLPLGHYCGNTTSQREQSRKWLVDKLALVQDSLDDGHCTVGHLDNMLMKADGCGTQADSNDQLCNCAHQATLEQLVNAQIALMVPGEGCCP